jgi:hypothetical protein
VPRKIESKLIIKRYGSMVSIVFNCFRTRISGGSRQQCNEISRTIKSGNLFSSWPTIGFSTKAVMNESMKVKFAPVIRDEARIAAK